MIDVAIVSVAQSDHRRAVPELNEVEMVQPVVQAALEGVGATISDIDFTCSGSSDYLAGQAFSFVLTLDAVGAWPPIVESHVEMDGAWALYEAWLKIQAGHARSALVYGYSKASPGDLPRVLSRQIDPYYYQPLWPDSVALAGLQARAMLDAGDVTAEEMAAIAHRNRIAALDNPHAQLSGSPPVEELLAEEPLSDPLRRHDCPPITDGASAVVLAAGDRARAVVGPPGVDPGDRPSHRLPQPRRPRPTSRSVDRRGRRAAPVATGRFDVAELHAPFTHQEVILCDGARARRRVVVNPSGGALAANPMMAAGLLRIGEVASRITSGDADRGVAHATSGQLLQQNLVCVLEGE